MSKKRNKLKHLWLLLLILIGIVLGGANLSEFITKEGRNLYNAKKYEQATTLFELSLALNKDDIDTYYYYAKALEAMPMTYKVQKKLFDLANNSKSGAAASIAMQKLSKYRYYILTQSSPNYIKQTPHQDKVLRWNPSTFPLKVYIEPDSSVPPYYFQNAKKAFLTWQNVTRNYIKFSFTDTANNADIHFKFIDKDNTDCNSSDCKYILAYAKPTIAGNKLIKFDIHFSKTDNNNKSFSPRNIYLPAMHEIGHALGIMGHSFYEDNLMFPSNIEEDPLYSKFRAKGINLEDLNTIKLLYAIKPDITNEEFSENDSQKLIYAPIIFGSKEEMNNDKIIQAKRYIQGAPNLVNGYVDLATAYYELNNYPKAIESLQEALKRAGGKDERYQILYNLAITYYESRDYDNAQIYTQMALNLDNNGELNALNAYLKYKLNNKEFAKNELKSMVSRDDANIDAAQYLIMIYLEEKQILNAVKVLKAIKESNPEAKNDRRTKQFGFLNLFL